MVRRSRSCTAEGVQSLQGLDRAKHRARGGSQGNFMNPFLTLNCFRQRDGDDNAVVCTPYLVPCEIADGVRSGGVAGKQVASSQHGEEQEEGRVLEHLEDDDLTPGGPRRWDGVEEVHQYGWGNW